MVMLLFVTNLSTYLFSGPNKSAPYKPSAYNSAYDIERPPKTQEGLYLIHEAEKFVYDLNGFERKVRSVSKDLDVPPEWLMAVMHSESRFDASVKNLKGSGATGLIQFMPTTAKDMEISIEKIRNMNHVEQLDFVRDYLAGKKRYHDVDFTDLTQLYLAILYPRALGEGPCYTLYATPSVAYKQNSGLDENKDGRVTVQDIDARMLRMYPTAYRTKNPAFDNGEGIFDRFFSGR